jgi:membrane protease YdiL (CAAX protease family)
MSVIDASNTKEHSFPTYGRQFKSYRWYKPIIVGVLFIAFYIAFAVILIVGVSFAASSKATPDAVIETLRSVLATSYDDMDLANAWQSVVSLGAVAVMIPALWLASVVVRDRPFSSYSSSRGGWSSRVFWKSFPVAFICISIPILVDELVVNHNIDNFQMKFSLASFAVVTILGPLQCIAEEYAFRSLLMQTFGSWFRIPVIAVILQAVVFASQHPYNTVGKIGILVSGCVFGLSAWIGRGIEVSSALHVANNMTLFYLEGMNLTTIDSTSTMHDLILDLCTGAAYVLLIFIISRRHNWFNKIRRDDAGAWNKRIDDKIERKEAKAAAKAEKKAEKNAPIGTHEESSPGKHFKQ